MTIEKHVGTCAKCGIVGPVVRFGSQWICKRDLKWEEDLRGSADAQEKLEKFQRIFRG